MNHALKMQGEKKYIILCEGDIYHTGYKSLEKN